MARRSPSGARPAARRGRRPGRERAGAVGQHHDRGHRRPGVGNRSGAAPAAVRGALRDPRVGGGARQRAAAKRGRAVGLPDAGRERVGVRAAGWRATLRGALSALPGPDGRRGSEPGSDRSDAQHRRPVSFLAGAGRSAHRAREPVDGNATELWRRVERDRCMVARRPDLLRVDRLRHGGRVRPLAPALGPCVHRTLLALGRRRLAARSAVRARGARRHRDDQSGRQGRGRDGARFKRRALASRAEAGPAFEQ